MDLLRWPKGGLYPLIPYSGRIRGGVLDGFGARLTPHPEAAPHTLHGPAHRQAWLLRDLSTAAATMVLDRAADDEWPWRIAAWLRVSLPTPDRAVVAIGLRNADARPMPAGIGLHPYFPTESGMAVVARTGVDWPVDADGLAGWPAMVGASAGFPGRGELTLFRSGWDGIARAGLPGGGTVQLRVQRGGMDHLVIHRPASGAYLCLEPASHVPDGFNLHHRGAAGTGTVTLGPAEAMEGEVELRLLA